MLLLELSLLGEPKHARMAVGAKESTVCWKSFFEDMEQRGLNEPLLVVIDGNSGLGKAVRELDSLKIQTSARSSGQFVA